MVEFLIAVRNQNQKKTLLENFPLDSQLSNWLNTHRINVLNECM